MKRWWGNLLSGLFLGLFCFFLYQQKVLERLELVTYDWRLKVTAPETTTLFPFVIVGITESFQRKLGQEFSREYFTRFLDICRQEGASVIGFDIFFPDLKEKKTDQSLADSLRTAGYTVLPVFSPEALEEKPGVAFSVRTLRGSHHLFASAARSAGHINVVPDADRTVRRLPFLLRHENTVVPQLSLEMVRLWSGEREIQAEIVRGLRRQHAVVPLGPSGCFYLRFLKPKELAKYFHSFEDILLGYYPRHLLRNKIVLVGQTIVGAKNADLVPTPFGIQFGAMVQATALWTALGDAYIWRLDHRVMFVLLVLAGLISRLIFSGKQPAVNTLIVLVCFSCLTWFSLLCLRKNSLFLDIMPVGAVFTGSYLFSLIFSLQASLKALFKKEAALSVLEETEREIAKLLRPEDFVGVIPSGEIPNFQTSQTIEETSEIALRTLLVSLGIDSGAIIVFPEHGQPKVLVSSGSLWSQVDLERIQEKILSGSQLLLVS
ncbi:MAG: CHASE2 domain-containing protein, partial [Candidatus Omnitrophica bacterium]|nr:CHASE2 domain-containing protein [Candidatus Omnitrophota bacterium]